MSESRNDDLDPEVVRGLERSQRQERRDRAEQLEHEFRSDEKIVQVIAGPEDQPQEGEGSASS